MGPRDTRSAALRAVAGSPSLRRVIVGFWLYIVSEYASWSALLYFAYTRGGPAESGLVAIVQLIPAAVLAPVLAAAADRYPPGRVLVCGLVAQSAGLAVAVAAMLSAAPAGWWLSGAILYSVAATSTRPAQTAVLPCVSRSAVELAGAAVVLGWAEHLGVAAAGVLLGVVLTLSGPAVVVGVCAGCAAAAVPLVARVPSVAVAVAEDQSGSAPATSVLDGLRALATAPRDRLVVALATGMWIVVGALDVLFAVLAVGVLHAGSSWVGYLNTAVGVGGVLGGMLSLRLLGRKLGTPILLSAALISAAMAVTAGSRSLALTCVLLAAFGVGRAVLTVASSMLLQRSVDPQRLARIFGLVEGLSMAGLALGSVLVPALMHLGGSVLALLGTAAVLPLIAVAGGRRIWCLDDGTSRPAVEIRLLRALPHFRPLPSQLLERLALAAERVEASAGVELVREGEHGEHFFVLAAGEADVLVDGRCVNHLGAGAAFGEVAVLRAVPRSATVVTTTPAELYRIAGRTLMPVLSGHTATWQSAEQVADAHLADDRDRAVGR